MTYICIDTRECFAKGPKKGCMALSITYEKDGACPFCKKRRDITDGKYYPLNKKTPREP